MYKRQAKGLTAFALTDHDTTAGVKEAVAYGQEKGIEVIPGIEFSTEYYGKDIHIVGLFIDEDAPAFQEQIGSFVDVYKRQLLYFGAAQLLF